jgi:hypothetical protein
MTKDQFDATYRGFCRRRPFRTFLIELFSGHQLPISHPEAVRDEDKLYVMRFRDGGNAVFAAESVACFLNLPRATAQ